MSKQGVYEAVRSIRPPEMFGHGKEELYSKYEACLSEIDPRDNDDVLYMLSAMNEFFEELLAYIGDRSLQDFLDGTIKDKKSMPMLLETKDEKKEVRNIPYVVANWIGLIAYTRKKYLTEGELR